MTFKRDRGNLTVKLKIGYFRTERYDILVRTFMT